MQVQQIGAARIFNRSESMALAVRLAAREHMLRKFAVGEYSDPAVANAIVQDQFEFYSARLAPQIAKIADRGSLEFVLYQYDQSALILHGQGISDPGLRQRWIEREGGFRRGMKYLAELITAYGPAGGLPPDREQQVAMDYALIAAESMADLAEMSHRVHGMFSDAATVTIHPPGQELDWEVHIGGKYAGYDVRMMQRVARDRQHRGTFLSGPQFDLHTDRHAEVLDPAFKRDFGWEYGRFISALWHLIENSLPAPNAIPTLFLNRRTIEHFFASHHEPAKAVAAMLDGFTVTPEGMQAEKRALWNPKQHQRAYRRGFFAFPDPTGPHLAFSRDMAKENLMQLINGVCYKRLPSEWKTKATSAALEVLSKKASDWFEQQVNRNLQGVGIAGGRCKNQVSVRGKSIAIPPEVGEIDFLGIHVAENLLVLAEAKMCLTGLEAKFWRDDVELFATARDCYAVKFRRKIAWCSAHRRELADLFGLKAEPRLARVLVTLYPCIADLFIPDFPCVSLAELMLDYKVRNIWPYSTT
jgi:hypothetical protein